MRTRAHIPPSFSLNLQNPRRKEKGNFRVSSDSPLLLTADCGTAPFGTGLQDVGAVRLPSWYKRPSRGPGHGIYPPWVGRPSRRGVTTRRTADRGLLKGCRRGLPRAWLLSRVLRVSSGRPRRCGSWGRAGRRGRARGVEGTDGSDGGSARVKSLPVRLRTLVPRTETFPALLHRRRLPPPSESRALRGTERSGTRAEEGEWESGSQLKRTPSLKAFRATGSSLMPGPYARGWTGGGGTLGGHPRVARALSRLHGGDARGVGPTTPHVALDAKGRWIGGERLLGRGIFQSRVPFLRPENASKTKQS